MGRLLRRRIFITVAALLVLTPLVVLRALNSPRFQKRMLALASEHGPWEFSVQSLHFSFWEGRITITGFSMYQKKTQHRLEADRLSIQINPWRAVIAQLGIRDIRGENILLDLSQGAPPGPKDSQRLNWSRILLLKNLRIARSQLDNIIVRLPNQKQTRARTMTLSFQPTLLRHINLLLNIKEVEWQEGDVITSTVDKLSLRGDTNVSQWQNAAPYLNDVEGTLKVDDAIIGDNTINYLRTKIDYKDLRFEMDNLDLLVNHRQITGSASLDMEKQKYAMNIDIPQPIEIRTSWDAEKAISLGGSIHGKIHIEGEKFKLKEGQGRFDIAVTQTPKKELATAVPISITTKGTWGKGLVTVQPSTIKVQEGTIQFAGKVDLASPSMNLPFTVSQVPLQPVFGRFNDVSFHPISGVTNGQGTIRGWGKSFTVDGVADVTTAAYLPILTERAHVIVKATPDKFTLNGDIYQRGRASGHCDMALTMRHLPGKGNDILDLKASLDHHDLGPTMAALSWRGIATATFEIRGPTGHYTATGKATVTDGSIGAIPYKSLVTTAHLVPQRIDFENTVVEFPRLPVYQLTQPITLRFSPGMFTFDGHPMTNFSLRGRYRYAGKVWQFDELKVGRVVGSGSVANGNLNAHVRGVADTAILTTMREIFRDAVGDVAVDVRLLGPVGNPSVTGTLAMQDNSVLLRGSPYRAENLQGTLRFTGHEARFDGVRGAIEDGSFSVGGTAAFDRYKIGKFDLRITGKDIRYAAMGGALRLEMDTDLTWSGMPDRSLLSGDMVIQDGLYAKDFNIFDKLTGGNIQRAGVSSNSEAASTALGLNLRIRNTGEIRVRNNAANVSLSANIIATGTEARPVVVGSIQTEDGILNYVGLRFTIARGLVEFRGDLDNPYIEFVGERDMYSSGDQNYIISLTLAGPINNLKYDLSSSPPQDRASLISLLLTGATPEELRNQPGGASGSRYAASQVGAALAAPLASAFRLDTVRLESGMTTSLLSNTVAPSTAPGTQRLYLGKRLSERLSLSFSTDVGGLNPQQSVVAEYLLTDYLLIKGGQSSNENFGFNLTFRFRGRE